VAQIRELVPGAFSDGELDAGSLIAALGGSSDGLPAFRFTWPGIDMARREAQMPTTATLVPDAAASVNWDIAHDVLIEGDNLQVLKLLRNPYRAKAKLIYIDPPYNTGETFTYNDDFSVPETEYLSLTGQVDDQGNVTTSRTESGGRKHSPWLTMMFPRLSIARHLLRRDGVILISIDNNEVHHLRLLLDAVFGAANFVDMMTWRGARKGDGKLTAGGQDYIIVYARDLAHLKANDTRWRERKPGLEKIYAKVTELRAEFGTNYEEATKALREWFKSLSDEDPSKSHDYYRNMDDKGIWFSDNISSPNYRENLIYQWKGYDPPENGWRYEPATMERLDAEGRLIYPTDMSKRVQIKSYLHDHEEWAPASVFYRDRRAASKSLDELMGNRVFDNPKSTDVLARLFGAMTDDGDLIVDFFGGSGSTGQAVWEQNRMDNKQRHWVVVQAPEPPDTSEQAGENAVEAGYSTIFEIAAERLRRAASAIQQSDPLAAELGFRLFRTRPTNLNIDKPVLAEEGMTGEEYVQMALDNSEASPIAIGAAPLAVAWEVAVKAAGTRLDAQVVQHDAEGIAVFEFLSDGARLLVSLDSFDLKSADAVDLNDDDVLILRGDKVSDATALTLAPRLQSKLMMVERVPREVSL